MKKAILLVFVLSVMLVASSAFAVVSLSKHNLSSSGNQGPHTSDANATVCGFCHIPHGGDITFDGVPLWARNLALNAAGGVYQVYGGLGAAAGVTLNTTPVAQPGPNSLTCLSCHDGTVGLGVTYKNGWANTEIGIDQAGGGFVGNGFSANALDYAGYNNMSSYNPAIGGLSGTDLRNDHPVGIEYIVGRAGLVAAPAWAKLYNYGLIVNQMECASCHEPHDTTYGSFLRDAKATLCQGCHANK